MEEYEKLLDYLTRLVSKWEDEKNTLRECAECEPYAGRANSLNAKAKTYGRCIADVRFALRKNGVQ